MESEYYKVEFAKTCKKKSTHGFQGCANFGKGCNEGGYYLASYSPEGLCHECELKQFPERFHGCFFCRYAIYLSSGMCMACSKGFTSWAENIFSSYKRKTFANDVVLGLHSMKNNYTIKKVSFLFQEFPDLWKSWPGFYAGDKKWLKPDPSEFKDKIDVSDITFETRINVIERELKKIGITIYGDVQIINK